LLSPVARAVRAFRWGTSPSEKISVTLCEPTEHDEHTIIAGMWQYGDYNNLGSYCEFR
jgi:hypothetical protein